MKLKNNQIVGLYGESRACDFLIGNGYKILERNYKNTIGEIDIIAKQLDTLVFVEVKRRMTSSKGSGRFAVNKYKQDKIKKIATVYLKKNKLLDSHIRFDVIELNDEEVVHLVAAFY